MEILGHPHVRRSASHEENVSCPVASDTFMPAVENTSSSIAPTAAEAVATPDAGSPSCSSSPSSSCGVAADGSEGVEVEGAAPPLPRQTPAICRHLRALTCRPKCRGRSRAETVGVSPNQALPQCLSTWSLPPLSQTATGTIDTQAPRRYLQQQSVSRKAMATTRHSTHCQSGWHHQQQSISEPP